VRKVKRWLDYKSWGCLPFAKQNDSIFHLIMPIYTIFYHPNAFPSGRIQTEHKSGLLLFLFIYLISLNIKPPRPSLSFCLVFGLSKHPIDNWKNLTRQTSCLFCSHFYQSFIFLLLLMNWGCIQKISFSSCFKFNQIWFW
jgi:hypothetical protein